MRMVAVHASWVLLGGMFMNGCKGQKVQNDRNIAQDQQPGSTPLPADIPQIRQVQAPSVLATAARIHQGRGDQTARSRRPSRPTRVSRRQRRGSEAQAPRPVKLARPGDYRITGPYSHKNLSIYLVHGKDQTHGKTYLTLEEAMDRKLVRVHETGDVNKLAIENVSAMAVFIQAGDIVKGGKQDRVLGYDLVLEPKSGKVPIAAYCVEQDRWSQRGGEGAAVFGSSRAMANTNAMKFGYRGSGKSQRKVWRTVGQLQAMLGGSLAKSVRAAESASSLQLTLEDKDVQTNADEYVQKLKRTTDGQKGVIGYVYAINGELNSGDLYATHALFHKLWPKLLRSNAIEAIAELKKDKTFTPPAIDKVRALLEYPETSLGRVTEVNKKLEEVELEYDGNVLFETRSKDDQDLWIRRSYLVK